MVSAVQQSIDGWKKALIDLGKNNRLIYYRPLRRASIQVVEPDLYELFDALDSERALQAGLSVRLVGSRPAQVTRSPSTDETSNVEDGPTRQRLEQYFASTGDLETERAPREQDLSLKALQQFAHGNAFVFQFGKKVLGVHDLLCRWRKAHDDNSLRTVS